MNTMKTVISTAMSELARRRWKKTAKKERKAHASKMGLASSAARVRKSAL